MKLVEVIRLLIYNLRCSSWGVMVLTSIKSVSNTSSCSLVCAFIIGQYKMSVPFCFVFQKYGFLLRRETVKTWTVFTCLNCRKKTHSINRELKVILVNKDMEVSDTLVHLSRILRSHISISADCCALQEGNAQYRSEVILVRKDMEVIDTLVHLSRSMCSLVSVSLHLCELREGNTHHHLEL